MSGRRRRWYGQTHNAPKGAARGPRPRIPNTLALERDLSARLGLPVSLTPKGAGGTLQIAYGSLEQLDGLLRRLS